MNTITKTREDETCVYTYTYDDLGNVLTTATQYNDLPLVTTTQTFNDDGSRATLVTPAGTFTYSYTAGKLSGIAGPGISGAWTYDTTGRINRINYGASGAYSLPHYDADAMVGVTNYGPGSTQYSYCATSRDGQGNVTYKYEYFGEDDPYNESTSYTYDTKNQLTTEDFSRANAPDDYDFTYDAGGNPLYFRSAGPHADADDNNQFTDPGFTYDAAGRRMWKEVSGVRTYFPYDGNAPVLAFRYYDPQIGRWLTRDPLGYDNGLNLYRYCGNNPGSGADPSGTWSWSIKNGLVIGPEERPWLQFTALRILSMA